MAIQNDQSVHTTAKTLINTVGNVRETVNVLLNYNPATTPLTDIQIRWLLHSPFESIIKNILFFEMVYGAALESMKREYIYKLLKKIGLKELAVRYHEWLLKREAAQNKQYPLPEVMLQFERFRPTPAPQTYTKEQLHQLSIRLSDLYSALTLVKAELSTLYAKHQELVKNLLQLNKYHVDTVSAVATENRVALQPDQIITILPEAHTKYHAARTPLDEIRALGFLINEGISANNNIIFVKQFLKSTALGTVLTSHEDALGMLNIQFSMVTEAIMTCQMRHSEIVGQIEEVEAIVSKAKNHAAATLPSPRPESKQFVTKDLHEMLASWSPHDAVSAKTVGQSKTLLSKIATRPSLAEENKLAVVLDTKVSPEDDGGIGRLETSADKLAPKKQAHLPFLEEALSRPGC